MSDPKPGHPTIRGWGWPAASRKAHYFVGGRSLCGKWLFLGDVKDESAKSPDDCVGCRRDYDKTYAPKEAPKP